jgi:hypothetical protein
VTLYTFFRNPKNPRGEILPQVADITSRIVEGVLWESNAPSIIFFRIKNMSYNETYKGEDCVRKLDCWCRRVGDHLDRRDRCGLVRCNCCDTSGLEDGQGAHFCCRFEGEVLTRASSFSFFELSRLQGEVQTVPRHHTCGRERRGWSCKPTRLVYLNGPGRDKPCSLLNS